MSEVKSVETQLVPYDLDAAKVEELKAKYLDVTIKPDDKAAYAMVMAGQRECREIRLACEEWHKDRKAWIVKAGRHYDGERRRVLGLLSPIEDHLKEVRKAEDDRKAAIEKERIDGIQARIAEMRNTFLTIQRHPLPEMRSIMSRILDIDLTAKVFHEFLPEAEKVREQVVSDLMIAIDAREKWEKEEAERKAEAERLKKIGEEQAREAERIAEAQRKLEAEKAAIEAQKKAEQDRKDREALEKRLAEEAKAKAEKDAAEKIEREVKEKKEREEKEAAEKARLEALRPDKERLLVWAAYLDTIEGPKVKSDDAAQIVSEAEKCIGKAAALIRKAVKEMK